MRILLTGPPAAGKSTLAGILAEDVGGPVIDYDVIARNLGSTGHDHPATIRDRAKAEMARLTRETHGPAVLIRSAPRKADREALAREFGADVVLVLPTPADEAKLRATKADRPSWTADAIDRWWSRFESSPIDTPLGGKQELPAFLAGLRLHPADNGWSVRVPMSADPAAEQEQQQVAPPQSAPDGNGNQVSGNTSTAADGFKPITSQEEFNRALNDRLTRERAKFQDYGDLKKKAEQFDAIAEANKTELQKIQDRAEAAEKRAADLEAADQKRQADAEQAKQVADWKTQIAADTGVPASALRGGTEEDLKAHAEELKALLPDPNARRGGGAYVPAEGRQQTGSAAADPRQLFADILKNA